MDKIEHYSDSELLQEIQERFSETTENLEKLKNLSLELKEANKRLQKSEAVKSQFIANISSEIVNPFMSILGLSKTLLEQEGIDWEKMQLMVSMVHSEAFNLEVQLKNIFMAARLESKIVTPEITKVNICELINSLVEVFKYDAQKKNITIKYINKVCDNSNDNTFYYKTDAEKLRIILSNLLSNAIRFSFENGTVEIITDLIDKDLHVFVKDYGTGLFEKNEEIVRQRYYGEKDGLNNQYRGHKLGLSVNKALLDLLNGEIYIQSSRNEGSVFEIKIAESEQADVKDVAMDDNQFFFDDNEL